MLDRLRHSCKRLHLGVSLDAFQELLFPAGVLVGDPGVLRSLDGEGARRIMLHWLISCEGRWQSCAAPGVSSMVGIAGSRNSHQKGLGSVLLCECWRAKDLSAADVRECMTRRLY